ncbi:low molecular weight protein-tyrosine-phosphatase [Cohnella zeiphila]|uniref:protein-tyrosine-phosphatase n=1 Tax=Cohnella zeiphila TaxID=2761120 RepID=A0A7X0VUE3_9BACL|nr:low molecular weight protein-tyrosine-phosphatase [Cohnella zeiphila]MBB6730330.1 low molecular weight phosphotyrosine protein phosphatase [Cohnella zeiphila]
MYSVMFVCLGNICRSPMAEAVFRAKIRERGLESQVRVASAGTGNWHIGKPPHEGTRKILDRHEISWDGLTASCITEEDGEKFDLIVAMDRRNESDIRAVIGEDARAEVIRFLSLVPELGVEDVPDPFFTGNFEEVYEMVTAGCERLAEQVEHRVR